MINRMNSNPMLNVRNMIQAMKAAKNPTAYLQNIMLQNPQLQQILQQSGGNPQMAFNNLARQMGVDPNEAINAFKRMF